MNENQIYLIAHSLGIRYLECKLSLREKDKFLPDEFYRNYYNYGDFTKDMQSLEKDGFIKKTTPLDLICFSVTDNGINEFRKIFQKEITETYIPLSRSKEKYLNYLNSDCCETFAEYNGIYIPKREYNSQGLIRFVSTKHYEVKGEYQKTVKDAKQSYKTLLKEFKNNHTK